MIDYAEAFSANNAKLTAYLRQITAEHEDAEDIAGETWLKVWSARERFRGDCAIYTFLCVIARNELFTRRRVKAARDRRGETLSLTDMEIPCEDESNLASSQIVDRLMAGEGSDERAIVRLRFTYGLENTEIARALGKTEAWVKTRMFRLVARKRRVKI